MMANLSKLATTRQVTMPMSQKYSAAMVSAVIRKIDVIDETADEIGLIMRIAHSPHPFVVSFVNQHIINLAWNSPDFAAHLIASDVLLRDGVGIELCLTTLGRSPGRNMNGTDFIPRLATAFAGRRVAVLGTVEPWISTAAAALMASGCEIVSKMDGFRPEQDYVAEVQRTSPDLVILAMGNPKQERVATMIAESVKMPMAIVNGGAIADFLGKRFQRAPRWVRRLRGEWLFRILQEPGRLWRRYLLGGFTFVRYVWLLRTAS